METREIARKLVKEIFKMQVWTKHSLEELLVEFLDNLRDENNNK